MTARASAIAVAFVANGLGGPSFLPRLPERQGDLGLSDAGLGAVLAGMALGALAASPLAGRAVERLGSRPVVVGSAVVLGTSLWTAGAAPGPAVLFAALALVGAADAAMDIAMNANGSAFERRTRRSVLHRLHGAWSLGALGAAGVAAAAAALDVPLTVHLLAVGAAIAGGVVLVRGGLVAGRGEPAHLAPAPPGDTAGAAAGTPGAARPRSRRTAALVVLAAATVGGAVIEGAPADWSAIRLERLGAGPGAAALGFAAFMAGMLAGRLVGDRLTDRFGGAAVLRGGMIAVGAGLGAGVLANNPAVFAVGLVLAGAGASGLFPLAFSAAGTTPGVPPGAGAATVSLAARLGFLAEPLLVGALAEVAGLRWAFAAVGAVALTIAAAAPRIVPPSARPVEAAVGDVRAV
ncbi:MAG TPA: MFS transporter [Acidimicrobiales bacterium]